LTAPTGSPARKLPIADGDIECAGLGVAEAKAFALDSDARICAARVFVDDREVGRQRSAGAARGCKSKESSSHVEAPAGIVNQMPGKAPPLERVICARGERGRPRHC
jgi:hypothetical protein